MTKDKRELWFKRRRYGWGWTPVKWQGWIPIVGFFTVVIGGLLYLPFGDEEVTVQAVVAYLIYVALASVLLIVVGYQRGPEPRWRWGWKEGDDPDQDR
jgi:predicted membrane channel-forming protein YqfA (hemolysin III family)